MLLAPLPLIIHFLPDDLKVAFGLFFIHNCITVGVRPSLRGIKSCCDLAYNKSINIELYSCSITILEYFYYYYYYFCQKFLGHQE
jgi:hypothetical protein